MITPDASIVGAILAVLFVAVALAEQARPRWMPRADATTRWCVNLTLYALSTTLRLVLPSALAMIAWVGLDPIAPPPAHGPWMWAHVIAAILGMDLASYIVHRLWHEFPWLWRIHAVHHSDIDLDVTTSIRNHPIEFLPLAAVAVIAFWLGATPAELALYGMLAFAVQLLAHANLALPAWTESAMSRIVVTPHFHHVHHSRDERDFNTNYGEVFVIWDRLFGTAAPGQIPESFGVDGLTAAQDQTISALLLQPLRTAGEPLP